MSSRVALVTGAASGIGAACAARLLASGMRVAGLDLRPPAPSTASSGDVVWWGDGVDVSNGEQVRAYVRQVEDALGSVDVVVNSAGIAGSGQYITETTEEELSRIIAVDLIGAILVAKATLPSMVRRGWGCIVNVASVAAIEGMPGHLPYCVAKAGLLNATRVMAWEYGRHGIRVNSIVPGLIQTPPTDAMFAKNPDLEHQMVHWAALRRMGGSEEIASAVAFLVSDDAAFVTGHSMIVDGGWTAGREPIPAPD